MNWAILIATVLSPIFASIVAVRATIWYQDRSERTKLKQDLFITMLKTRRRLDNYQFVDALNIVPAIYPSSHFVTLRHQEIMGIVNDAGWNDEANLPDLNARLNEAKDNFLHAISVDLGTPMERRHIKNVYFPSAGGLREDQEALARLLVINFLSGRQPIPVIVVPPPQADPPTVDVAT